jgi:Zn-dependent peptidase ImmA (M78 family)
MSDTREYQPEFGDDEIRQARRTVARQVANSVVTEFRLSGPPVDVAMIVAARGLRLEQSAVPGAVSGQLFPVQREVFINTHNRSRARQRFTLAHELGHWELRHHLEEDLPADSQGFEGVYESEGSSDGRSPMEIEANTFAAEVLMPGRWIKKERRPLATGRAHELALLYDVSRETMFYQLMHYRML